MDSNYVTRRQNSRRPSPSAYAAGWAMPASVPEVPLEAMHIVDEPPRAPRADAADRRRLDRRNSRRVLPDEGGLYRTIRRPRPQRLHGPRPRSSRRPCSTSRSKKASVTSSITPTNRSARIAASPSKTATTCCTTSTWNGGSAPASKWPPCRSCFESESPERQSLRQSIYRVFGRYRYHQTAHRTNELGESDALANEARRRHPRFRARSEEMAQQPA